MVHIMVEIMPFIVDALCLLGLFYGGRWFLRVTIEDLRGIQEAIREGNTGRVDSLSGIVEDLGAAVVKLEAEVDQLPHTWNEMHNKVRRVEERTRGAVRRAMQELEENGVESAELTEIGSQLRLGDGNGGPPSGMQPMPEGMATIPPQPAPPSDGRAEAIAYKWSR